MILTDDEMGVLRISSLALAIGFEAAFACLTGDLGRAELMARLPPEIVRRMQARAAETARLIRLCDAHRRAPASFLAPGGEA